MKCLVNTGLIMQTTHFGTQRGTSELRPTSDPQRGSSELRRPTSEPQRGSSELRRPTSEPQRGTSELRRPTSEPRRCTSSGLSTISLVLSVIVDTTFCDGEFILFQPPNSMPPPKRRRNSLSRCRRCCHLHWQAGC